MGDKVYFGTQSVSNSSLGWFRTSPKYFIKRLFGEIEEEKKQWLEFGKQLHMAVLEPERFKANYVYLEYTVPSGEQQKNFCIDFVTYKQSQLTKKVPNKKVYTWAYKQNYSIKNKSENKIEEEAQNLHQKLKKYISYLELSSKYKDVLAKSKWDSIQEAVKTIKKHKIAKKLLFDEKHDLFGDDDDVIKDNELAIYWEFPIDINGENMKCKSRLDRLTIDHKNKVIKLMDLKKTKSLKNFKESFEDLEYNRQLAFYWLAVHFMFKHSFPEYDINDYSKETYIIAVQVNQLTECKVFEISEYDLNRGMLEIEKLMVEISWHLVNDKWDYSKEYYLGDGVEKL